MTKTTLWYEVFWSNSWVSLYTHPMEVTKETEHTIVTKFGRTLKKRKRSRFFPTFKEAQDHAVGELNVRITTLQDQRDEILAKKP